MASSSTHSFSRTQALALEELRKAPSRKTLEACYEAFSDHIADLYQKVLNHIKDVRKKEGLDTTLGVILDIDETILFNEEDSISLNRYMGPFMELFKREDVLVFFVTGRILKHREATINQLHSLGLEKERDYEELFCKAPELYGIYPKKNVVPEENLSSVTLYKQNIRYFIASEYNVMLVLSMGDQFSDVDGDLFPNGTPRHRNLTHIQWVKLFSSYDIP